MHTANSGSLQLFAAVVVLRAPQAVDVRQLMGETTWMLSSSFSCTNHYRAQPIKHLSLHYILHSYSHGNWLMWSLCICSGDCSDPNNYCQFPSSPTCHLSWNYWSIPAEGIPVGALHISLLLESNPNLTSDFILIANCTLNCAFIYIKSIWYSWLFSTFTNCIFVSFKTALNV